MKQVVKNLLDKIGYKIVRNSSDCKKEKPLPHDLDSDFVQLFSGNSQLICSGYNDKIYTTYKGTEYLVKNNIEGDFVECGVFQGRMVNMMLLALLKFGDDSRDVYLYDTFTGMTEPCVHDVKEHRGLTYEKNIKRQKARRKDGYNQRCYCSLDQVKKNVLATGYPENKIHFIKGDILETVPNQNHEKIAFLRLDTDFYESTKHELNYLYPLLVNKGFFSQDDYGSWQGARKAVDEYFEGSVSFPCLFRVNNSERSFVKSEN